MGQEEGLPLAPASSTRSIVVSPVRSFQTPPQRLGGVGVQERTWVLPEASSLSPGRLAPSEAVRSGGGRGAGVRGRAGGHHK